MGADVTFAGALYKAISEVAQAEKTFFFVAVPRLGHLPPMMEISPDAEYDEITDLFKTIAYYGYDSNLKKVEDFYAESEKILMEDVEISATGQDPHEKYEALLKIMEEGRLTPLCFDLTPPYFNNLKIQRSIIPELSTYFMIPRFLGHHRYYHLAKKLGLRDRSLSFDELHQTTIPFP